MPVGVIIARDTNTIHDVMCQQCLYHFQLWCHIGSIKISIHCKGMILQGRVTLAWGLLKLAFCLNGCFITHLQTPELKNHQK